MSMKKILVVGSSNMDLVIHADKLPKPGETIIGNNFIRYHGGKGANQAVAAARLGGEVSFITKVGSDDFGNELASSYLKEGMDCRGVLRSDNASTGVAFINVDRKGENSITVAQGANKNLTVDDLQDLTYLIDECDIVLVQLEIPMDTVNYLVRYAGRNMKKIILNPAPAQLIPDETLSMLFALTPNESEIELLTGVHVEDEESALHAANMLLKKGVKNVIITLGALGAHFIDQDEHLLIPAPRVNAVDTTAAGDIFNGAFAVAQANRRGIKESIEYACIVSSISVTRHGAQSSAPYKNEIHD